MRARSHIFRLCFSRVCVSESFTQRCVCVCVYQPVTVDVMVLPLLFARKLSHLRRCHHFSPHCQSVCLSFCISVILSTTLHQCTQCTCTRTHIHTHTYTCVGICVCINKATKRKLGDTLFQYNAHNIQNFRPRLRYS